MLIYEKDKSDIKYNNSIELIFNNFMEYEENSFFNIKKYYFQFIDLLIGIDKISYFNTLINKYTKFYDCYCYENHGSIMLKYGLTQLTTEAYIRAIELGSLNPSCYIYISKEFYEIGEVDDSLEFCLNALEIEKDNKEGLKLLDELCSDNKSYKNLEIVKKYL